jgi:hypothetical protein
MFGVVEMVLDVVSGVVTRAVRDATVTGSGVVLEYTLSRAQPRA